MQGELGEQSELRVQGELRVPALALEEVSEILKSGMGCTGLSRSRQ